MPTSRDIRRLRELWLWLLLSFTSCHFSKVILTSVCVWNAMMIPVTPPELHQWNTCMHNTHTHMHTRSPKHAFFPVKHFLQTSAQHVSSGTSLFASIICFQSQEHDSPSEPSKERPGFSFGVSDITAVLLFLIAVQSFHPSSRR